MLNSTITKNHFPQDIITILETLEKNNQTGFVVGGAVRDLLMGNTPNEFDIASSAPPDQIETIFDTTIPVGKAFGTVIVTINKTSTEITTFRKESNYTDSRHPDTVSFSTNINDDLQRRDFTINAMAINPITNEFIDMFNGVEDIKTKQIQCVGNPTTRFEEDTLRAFRCFRFSAQLNFTIEATTLSALSALSKESTLPSIERIRKEMDQLLSFQNGMKQ